MKVLGLSGSLRATSSNTALLESILYGRGLGERSPLSSLQVSLYNGIDQLPYYNADLDQGASLPTVADWRSALAQADGVIICTPEYAFGVPGVLKNALDWIASSGEF
jgi:chromate reductase, NAD(P)H dehydrogenase (quinone)